ncbi:serine hydrolase domain-containing protein [Niabella insulamsoli]|uniref:serine hydrolase domain-containing protein n=1 Tax=Niabella insulamsoli TaxID=3144874 RepID=UPI0031FD6027
MNCLRPALLLFFVGFFGTRLTAQSLQSEINHLMEKYRAVGLALVAVKDNKIIYNESFGLKDIETKTPLSQRDIFRIASISKSFSATAIMQLVAQGKLALTDDVSKLIGFRVRNPKFPKTTITLKMLLSHRSSLNDSQGYFTLDSINPATSPNTAKCYNDYEPGKGYEYCNLNFNIIGAIIEKVSGKRFDQYIKNAILDPLELYGGYCVDSLHQSLFTTLYGFDAANDRFEAAPEAYAPRREQIAHYRMGHSTPVFSPTGGMKISAPDLARYMIMHMNYGKGKGVRIMKKKYAKLMQQPLTEKNGYGLALLTTQKLIPGIRLTGHTGSAYGLYSAMFFEPEKKFGFVVITNGCLYSETEGTVDLHKDAINLLYKHLIQ